MDQVVAHLATIRMLKGKVFIGRKKVGKKREELAELGLLLVDGGTEAEVQSPHCCNCLGQRRNI